MVINPTCSSCKDGQIIVDINGGKKPYEFRLRGPGIAVPVWEQSDVPFGSTKTFSNIGVGIYFVDVDTDGVLGSQTCVQTLRVVIEDPCPTEEDCPVCEYALDFDPTPGTPDITSTPGEFVRYINADPNDPTIAPFPPYQIGISPYTVEMWVRPKQDDTTTVLFYRSNHPSDNSHWTNIIDPTQPYVYNTIFLQKTSAGFHVTVAFSTTILPVNPGPPNYTTATAITGSNTNVSRARTAEVLITDEINHIVVVKRGVRISNSPTTHIDYTTGQPYPEWDVYINGAKATFPNLPASPNDAFYELTAPNVATLNNSNNWNGPILLGSYGANNGTVTVPVYANANMTVTNLRMYRRALSKVEIQENCFLGCRAEPSNCSNLIIYSPLNQVEKGITPELRYGNHGDLINFADKRTVRNGGAWVKECCGSSINVEQYTCINSDCIDDAVMFRFKVRDGIDDPVQIVYVINIGVAPETGAPPIVGDLVQAKDIIVDGAGSIGATDVVTDLANQINANAYWIALGAMASANIDELEIVIPYDDTKGVTLQEWCLKNLSITPVRAGAAPVVGDAITAIVTDATSDQGYGALTTGNYTVCCAPADCDNKEEVIVEI